MNILNSTLFILLTFLIVSCSSTTKNNEMNYYGYELSEKEYTEFRNKVELQKSAYEADTLWHIYDQLNDSIRSIMPDSIEFEVFLSILNNNEVGIDVFVPKNKEFFKKIGNAVMNSNYKEKMPKQRYLCIYTYTNTDGSEDIPLELAIKRNK